MFDCGISMSYSFFDKLFYFPVRGQEMKSYKRGLGNKEKFENTLDNGNKFLIFLETGEHANLFQGNKGTGIPLESLKNAMNQSRPF